MNWVCLIKLALKLSACLDIMGLLEAMGILQRAFQTKAIEFQDILKMGRTQLQGAVPMALGQDCGAFVPLRWQSLLCATIVASMILFWKVDSYLSS